MIGYGQQGPVQFPTPGDEDHERRAAEEYAGRSRGRRFMAWTAIVVIAVALVVLVAHPWHHGTPAHHGSLTFRFEPSSGHVKIVLADDRSGRHTTWVAIRNADGKLAFYGFAEFRDGGLQGVGSQSGWATASLAAGTYSYAVFDVAGIHYTIDKNGYERPKTGSPQGR